MSIQNTESPSDDTQTETVAWRVDPWRLCVGKMSRSKFYEERRGGYIETVKLGAATLVLTPPKQYVASLRERAAA